MKNYIGLHCCRSRLRCFGLFGVGFGFFWAEVRNFCCNFTRREHLNGGWEGRSLHSNGLCYGQLW